MDWPGFALISYAFVLLALLVLLFLHSYRKTKGRYLKQLTEKEHILTARQMDLEDTLTALSEQAAAMEAQRDFNREREQTALLSLQQRVVELQGAVVELQGGLRRLERAYAAKPADMAEAAFAPSQTQAPAPLGIPPAADAEEITPPAPVAGNKRRHAVVKHTTNEPPADPTPPEAEEGPSPCASEAEDRRRRMLRLLGAGWSVGDISRELNCSRMEVTILYNQWKKGLI